MFYYRCIFRCHPKSKDGRCHLVAVNDIAFHPQYAFISSSCTSRYYNRLGKLALIWICFLATMVPLLLLIMMAMLLIGMLKVVEDYLRYILLLSLLFSNRNIYMLELITNVISFFGQVKSLV